MKPFTTEELRDNVANLIANHPLKILTSFATQRQKEPGAVLVVLWDGPSSVASVTMGPVSHLLCMLEEKGEAIVNDIQKSIKGPNFFQGIPIYCRMHLGRKKFQDYYAVFCMDSFEGGIGVHGKN
jgi:hypothetical protein